MEGQRRLAHTATYPLTYLTQLPIISAQNCQTSLPLPSERSRKSDPTRRRSQRAGRSQTSRAARSVPRPRRSHSSTRGRSRGPDATCPIGLSGNRAWVVHPCPTDMCQLDTLCPIDTYQGGYGQKLCPFDISAPLIMSMGHACPPPTGKTYSLPKQHAACKLLKLSRQFFPN